MLDTYLESVFVVWEFAEIEPVVVVVVLMMMMLVMMLSNGGWGVEGENSMRGSTFVIDDYALNVSYPNVYVHFSFVAVYLNFSVDLSHFHLFLTPVGVYVVLFVAVSLLFLKTKSLSSRCLTISNLPFCQWANPP